MPPSWVDVIKLSLKGNTFFNNNSINFHMTLLLYYFYLIFPKTSVTFADFGYPV